MSASAEGTPEQRTFGDLVRSLMLERGFSIRALAKRVSFNPGYLSRVLRGERLPSMYLAEHLDRALGADGTLMTAAAQARPARPGKPSTTGAAGDDDACLDGVVVDQLSMAWLVGRLDRNMDRRTVLKLAAAMAGTPVVDAAACVERVTAALAGSSGLDEQTLQRLEDRTLGFHRLEAVFPAPQIFSGLLAHLDEITALLQTCSDGAIRSRLARAVGEAATLGAWLAWDGGDTTQAARLYRVARRAARQANDPAILACSVIYESFAVEHEQARRMLAEARTVLPQRLAPATWAWLVAREAEEAAALGDASASALVQAAAEGMSTAQPQAERPWTRCLVDTHFSGIGLTVASRLGDETRVHESLEELRPLTCDASQKSTGRRLASMALALARMGDLTEAVKLGHQSANAIQATHATYALDRLTELDSALPNSNAMAVRELRDDIAATRRQVLGSPHPSIADSY